MRATSLLLYLAPLIWLALLSKTLLKRLDTLQTQLSQPSVDGDGIIRSAKYAESLSYTLKSRALPDDAIKFTRLGLDSSVQAGKRSVLHMAFHSDVMIDNEAFAEVEVLLGEHQVLKQSFNICEEISNLGSDLKCVIPPGDHSIALNLLLPENTIPKGQILSHPSQRVYLIQGATARYSITLTGYKNKNGRRLFHFTVDANFIYPSSWLNLFEDWSVKTRREQQKILSIPLQKWWDFRAEMLFKREKSLRSRGVVQQQQQDQRREVF